MTRRLLLSLLALVSLPVLALASGNSLNPSSPPSEVQFYSTNTALLADNQPEGVIGYAKNTDTGYLRAGDKWMPLNIGAMTLPFSMRFDEGASKGLTLAAEAAGAAYSTTADALNYVTYGYPPIRFTFVTNTTATGTVTPTADANGLDLNGGSPGDNDEWTATFGTIEGTGGPAIIGTTPAFKFCASLDLADVSGSDGLWVEVTSTGLHVDLSSGDPNYTSYCAIGHISGNIYVSDNTTGGTDTTDDWVDGAEKDLCVLVSSGGACTYTINGVAPTVTDAHTLGDGVPHVARIQAINAADLTDDTHLRAVKWVLQ